MTVGDLIMMLQEKHETEEEIYHLPIVFYDKSGDEMREIHDITVHASIDPDNPGAALVEVTE